jgi:hypothetical protein
MARIQNRITGIEGVVNGGLGNFSLPTGPRYHALKLFTRVNGVLTLASDVVDRVRLKVNEITQWDVTADRLLRLAALDGTAPAVGELPINFSVPGRADKTDEQMTAWDTFGERSFSVELQLKNLPNPTDVPLITGLKIFDYGMTLAPDANGKMVRRKAIMRLSEATANLTSGMADIDQLQKRFPILRLLMDGTASIDFVEVNPDDTRHWEASKFENARILADYGLDPSQFNYPLCFDFTEQLSDFVQVAKTLNVRVTSAAANSVTVLQQYIAPGFND